MIRLGCLTKKTPCHAAVKKDYFMIRLWITAQVKIPATALHF